MASRSVKPFLQCTRSSQTETDRPCYSFSNNRPNLHSTAMWPNNEDNDDDTAANVQQILPGASDASVLEIRESTRRVSLQEASLYVDDQ